MRTIHVAENAVSIWFSQEEPPPRRQMLRLVRQALKDGGFAPWPETEAECFAAEGEALLIAHPGPTHPHVIFFDDLESLLGAVAACPDAESSLYAAENGYFLAVPPELRHPALYEFGAEASVSADRLAHAKEHGECLLPDRAIAELRRRFAT